jgi:hypothetical protein
MGGGQMGLQFISKNHILPAEKKKVQVLTVKPVHCFPVYYGSSPVDEPPDCVKIGQSSEKPVRS